MFECAQNKRILSARDIRMKNKEKSFHFRKKVRKHTH